MHPVKQQVVRLIHAYQAAVFRAVALLNAKSAQEPGFQRRRTGYLDAHQQFRYAFHGAGCLVTMPGLEVDFDYAKEGGCAGIDGWFLVNFLEYNPAVRAQHPLLTSGASVEEALLELAKACSPGKLTPWTAVTS
ncbi:DUF6896 domain-containing protein [Hymenobacter monticola]|uniref:DUF6896 domain-containing protein n=1 Tax=Hymenobacter monticola TaxID=1705399 RepID=A0ABY4B767_9BACT|nr:hypothetical protein [Hymenobacter monticola]UOE34619.1 hypothetical protein MTP16_02950 [Hymenobacter monticola]